MSSTLEFDGKDVDAAILTACKELGVKKEKLKYDVISYGSTGIFGLVGVKKARIKVFYKNNEKLQTTPGDVGDEHEKNGAEVELEKDVVTVKDENENEDEDEKNDGVSDPPPVLEEAMEDYKGYTFDDPPAILGKKALQRIIDLITTDAMITVDESDDELRFNIAGGNTAVLIGRRGKTLEAIQYIIEKIINKHHKDRIRIQIDVGEYLKIKQNNLVELAQRMAEKAVKKNKPFSIGKLNSYDRRIIHVALKSNKQVKTMSVGKNYYRRLVIFPKK